MGALTTRRALFAAAPATLLVAAQPAQGAELIDTLGADYIRLSGICASNDGENAASEATYRQADIARCNIARRIFGLPAKTEAQLRIKAFIAADWFGGDAEDMGDCLVASLLRDLGQSRGWLDHLTSSTGCWLEVA